MTVDTTLNSGGVNMKAYVFVPIGVPGATSGSMFTPVKVEMTAAEPELAGLDLLHKTKHSKVRSVEPVPELTKIAEAADKMENMLDIVIKYVSTCFKFAIWALIVLKRYYDIFTRFLYTQYFLGNFFWGKYFWTEGIFVY